MSIHIKSKATKQWLWFVGLWLGGLLAVAAISLIIKFAMWMVEKI